MRVVHLLAGCALAALSATPAMAAPSKPGKPRLACETAAFKAPADTTVTSVKPVDGATPYCRVDGYVTTNDPHPNQVRFQVSMPQNWNGRYVMTVPGGAAGLVPDPNPNFLSRGYAVGSTDKGTRASSGGDFSFRRDPAQSTDWNHRGVHVSSVASQEIARAYYARPKIYRYVMGCSGGGDGTLTEAEKYPTDYDAFIPGGMTYTPNVGVGWGVIAQHIFRDKARWLSKDDMVKVGQAIMAKYDASDGAQDGLIWDPTKIKLDRADFPFITDAQFSTLALMERGVPEVGGVSNPPFWLSNPSAFSPSVLGSTAPPWTAQTWPGLFTVTFTGAAALRSPSYNVLTDMEYTSPEQMAEEARLRKASGRTYFDPKNLEGVRKAGAKVIMWTGMADNAVPPLGVVNYTLDTEKAFGPARSGFFRSFFAPGMFHCLGGEGQPTDVPDVMLEAAQRWVEEGVAPDAVIASNAPREEKIVGLVVSTGAATGKATRTYRLCAYPSRPVFKGGLDNPHKLDVKDADNWRCQS